ncbi:MAG: hypothetical protein KDJ99_21085, partial [Candidatus Competibacteraceae bacterium]|nr:hypothetical protein [Candidatus Competibacteraceae bacterium]
QRLLARHAPAQQVLLLIDQFEEVFTQADRGQQQRFINAINVLRTLESCSLLLTMRADFYPDLMISELWPVDASQRVEITPLRGEALRAAIEKPATAVGVRLEDSLVARLLADAAEEPGVLPLLQETMSQLWLEMEQRVLSYAAYEKLSRNGASTTTDSASSGLAVAIASKADHTLAELKPPQQLIARRIFLRLIQFGEGRADTRRQQPVSALQALGDDQNAFDYTLEHLTDHRLLTRSGADEDEDSRVDIAHESLISSWTRLQDWVEERREAEQVRRRLDAKAAEWVRLGQGSGGLLDEAALPEAERWLASPDAGDLGFDATLPALVQASQLAIQRELAQAQAFANEQKRAASRLRRLMVGLVAVLLVAIAAGLFAWTQSQRADARRIEAQQSEQKAKQLAEAEALARAEAENARLASIAQLLLIQAPQQQDILADERGALLARQAYHLSSTGSRQLKVQVDSVLRTVVGKPYFSSILLQNGSDNVTFSPDSTQLVATYGGGKVLLWDLTQPGTAPIELSGYSKAVIIEGLVYSPDGKTLMIATADGSIGQWDMDNLNMPMIEPLPRHPGGAWSIAYSADGQWWALGNKFDDTFVLWDLSQPDREPVLVSHPRPAAAGSGPSIEAFGGVPVTFSSDSRMLATGSLNGIIHLWRPDDLTTPIISLRGHKGGLLALAFYDDGRYLASSGQDTTIRLWNLEQPSASPMLLEHGTSPAYSLSINAASHTLISGSAGGGIRLWQLDALDTPPVVISGGFINRVAFSPDGKRFASAGGDHNYLRFWELEPSGRPQVLTSNQGGVQSLAFSPDSKRLASGGSTGDGTIQLWHWDALSVPPEVFNAHEGTVNSLDFSIDGKQLLSASWNHNTVRLWTLDSPTPTFTDLSMLNSIRLPWTARFRPDGKTVAASGNGGVVTWDLADLSANATVLLPSGAQWTTGMAFSPNRNTLAMGS